MCTAPVLAHYNPAAKTILQTDASFFGWGFIILQISDDGEEHPIVIESGRFKGAQINYTTTEKEFLAIVEAFTRNRHMLLPVETLVLTDHHNLRYWQTPRQLSPRQARWAELLQGFRMKIVYRPGKMATMPDALSRRSDYHGGKGATELLEYNFVQALPNEEELPDFLRGAIEEQDEINPVSALLWALGEEDGVVSQELGLPGYEELREAQLVDPDLQDLRTDIGRGEGTSPIQTDIGIGRGNSTTPNSDGIGDGSRAFDHLKGKARNPGWKTARWPEGGLLEIDGRPYVSGKDIRARVIRSRHDMPTAGHPGIEKTQELMNRDYTWVGMGRDVESYVKGCVVCQRMKGYHGRKIGFLKTLEVPERPWQHLTMDFIDQLPRSHQFNAILVVVDRLTKWGVFLPCDVRINSSKLADLLIERVFSIHGLPDSIVSDRGSKFTSGFWGNVCERLKIERRLSTAYHPQTDGQTERVNQILEQYLRTFVNFRQDDWSLLLGQASMTYNNLNHSSIGMSPFYANHGFHPRWVETVGRVKEGEWPAATERIEDMVALHKLCAERMEEANRRYAKEHDKNRMEGGVYDAADRVMLSTEHLSSNQPSKKLSQRWMRPNTVFERDGTHAIPYDLPANMKIHPVVNVSRVKRFIEPRSDIQRTVVPDGVVMEDGTIEYEVKGILDSRVRRKRLEYLVEWTGYEGTDEAASWEKEVNVKGTADALIDEFHRSNPHKPGGARR